MTYENCDNLKEEMAELKAYSKINELKIEILLDLLTKEGILNRDEFVEKLGNLCEGDKE